MRDIYKNPILYYILAPAVLALWPLLTATVYIPRVEDNLKIEKEYYKEAKTIMHKILSLDIGRLELSSGGNNAIKFDYPTAVDNAAESCGIAPGDYQLSSKPGRSTSGQKNQGASVTLKQVGVTTFAEFISTLQLRWATLQCEDVTLTKKKDQLDSWKVDLNFKYYY